MSDNTLAELAATYRWDITPGDCHVAGLDRVDYTHPTTGTMVCVWSEKATGQFHAAHLWHRHNGLDPALSTILRSNVVAWLVAHGTAGAAA